VRLRWLACAGLALFYAVLAMPLNILKTMPMFFLQTHPEFAELAAPRLLKILDSYFFWSALAIFPAFVVLRLVAARIYASGLLDLAQSGRIPQGALSRLEAGAMDRLGLLESKPRPEAHRLMRLITWAGTRVGRIISRVAVALLWFSFVAQIYITEFLDNHGAKAWLNQPLVQLPWFHYLPGRLKSPAEPVLFAIFILLVFCLIRSITRVFTGRASDSPR